jgi:predicted transposase/invertase (TIGR01784 family)
VFPELKLLHAVFEIRARENPAVLLSEHFQMHFLRLGNLLRNNLADLDQLCLDLQRWMQFLGLGSKLEEEKMSTILQDVPEVQAAYEEYKRFSADPVMREKVQERERFLIDQRLDRASAKKEGKIEIARNMKQRGYDCGAIAELTGLSPHEIERLN